MTRKAVFIMFVDDQPSIVRYRRLDCSARG